MYLLVTNSKKEDEQLTADDADLHGWAISPRPFLSVSICVHLWLSFVVFVSLRLRGPKPIHFPRFPQRRQRTTSCAHCDSELRTPNSVDSALCTPYCPLSIRYFPDLPRPPTPKICAGRNVAARIFGEIPQIVQRSAPSPKIRAVSPPQPGLADLFRSATHPRPLPKVRNNFDTHLDFPVPGPRSLVPGPWSPVPGPWSPVPGPWSPVPGPRSPVPGPLCLIPNSEFRISNFFLKPQVSHLRRQGA